MDYNEMKYREHIYKFYLSFMPALIYRGLKSLNFHERYNKIQIYMSFIETKMQIGSIYRQKGDLCLQVFFQQLFRGWKFTS